MTPRELLEATKAEVDKRWVDRASLWDTIFVEGSCILGCLGFARWGEGFRTDSQNDGYRALECDATTAEAIAALAAHVSNSVAREFSFGDGDGTKYVYRQNDKHFGIKQDVKDFIDLALADFKSAQPHTEKNL